jgi:hypothetical protein
MGVATSSYLKNNPTIIRGLVRSDDLNPGDENRHYRGHLTDIYI